MNIEPLEIGIIGTISTIMVIIIVEIWRSHKEQFRRDLEEIYRPIFEELTSIDNVGRNRIGLGDRYPWTPSEEFNEIEKQGRLLVTKHRNLKNDIKHLKKLNSNLSENSRQLWQSIENEIEGAMQVLEENDKEGTIRQILQSPLRNNLKDQLFWPLYKGDKDGLFHWLDIQKEDWKFHEYIPKAKIIIDKTYSIVNERVDDLRQAYFESRDLFFVQLENMRNGLKKPIESRGRKRYKN